MSAYEVDTVLARFVHELSAPARRRIHMNPDAVRHIHAACRRLTPRELARIVSRDIGWQQPHNAEQVIAYRLAREAGRLPDDRDPNHPAQEGAQA